MIISSGWAHSLMFLSLFCYGCSGKVKADAPANSSDNRRAGGSGGTEQSDDGSGEPVDPNQPKFDNPAVVAPGSDAYVGEGSHSKECPAALPVIGSDCGNEAHYCQYGNSVRYDCREQIYCGPQGWSKLPSTTCNPPPEKFCPSSIPADGGECTPWEDSAQSVGFAQGTCEYDGGTLCGCFGLEVGAKWRCSTPPPNDECPRIAPNFGTTCSEQGLECIYGDPCTTGARLICRTGIWSSLEGDGVCGG